MTVFEARHYRASLLRQFAGEKTVTGRCYASARFRFSIASSISAVFL